MLKHLVLALLVMLPQEYYYRFNNAGQISVVSNGQDCEQSSDCGAGECRIWQEGRFVCEARQYTVAVWDRRCLDKLSLTENARLEAPVGFDGNPDTSKAVLYGTGVTFVKGCTFRWEIRHR